MFEVTRNNTMFCTWMLRCAIISTIHAGLSVADNTTLRWSTDRLSEGRYHISATSLPFQNLAFFAGGMTADAKGMIFV